MTNKSRIFKELTTEEIKIIIKNVFPKKQLTSQLLLTGGHFNTTYKIIFDDKSAYVLRVGPINRELLLPYEHNLMEAEVYFNTLCQNAKIVTPKVVVLNTEKTIIDRDFMVTEFIESIPLSEVSNIIAWMKNYHTQTGVIANKLKGIKGEKFGRLSNIKKGIAFEKWSEYILYELDEAIAKCREYSVFSQEELLMIRKCFTKRVNILDEIKTPVLVHADIWSGNILISKKEKKVISLIDGDRALFGDSEFEVASSWMNQKQFLKGYGGILNTSENAIERRNLYLLFNCLMDSYILKVEYAEDERWLNKKNWMLQEIKKFKG